MTLILTLVCVDPASMPEPVSGRLKLARAPDPKDGWASAGYVPGLARYFDEPISGIAYYVLQKEDGDYETSNALFSTGDDEDEHIARLAIPDDLRDKFDGYIRILLDASTVGRLFLLAEENGHVTSPDTSQEDMDTVDVIGPVSLDEFWTMHDLGEIPEDSITIIQLPRGSPIAAPTPPR